MSTTQEVSSALASYQYTVFLSHCSADKENAERLARDLTRAGVRVWLADWEIGPGDRITNKIEQGLVESRYVAVWLTKKSVASYWVQAEWRSRFHDQITSGQVILPLRA